MKSETKSSRFLSSTARKCVFTNFCNYEVKTFSYGIVCLGYIFGLSELLRFLFAC